MDSAADQAAEEFAILGKRKRDAEPRSTWNESTAAELTSERLPHAQGLNNKRLRLPPAADVSKDTTRLPGEQTSVSSNLNFMPVEILQHIFRFLDPFALGRLICVNQQFRMLLDPRGKPLTASGVHTGLTLISQDAIWSSSRRDFLSSIPEPVSELTELEMIQLILGKRCQFCGRFPTRRVFTTLSSRWNAGPGPDGVRAIWPFRVRSCADCLRPRLIKDQELILLPNSVLRSVLPFACFTPSLHYVATLTLKEGSLPANLQLTRYYFRPQIDELERKMQQVKSLGPVIHAQWYRGLESTLEDTISEVVRLERWEQPSHIVNQHDTSALDTSTISSYSGQGGLQGSSYTQSNYTSTNPSSWLHNGQGWKRTSQRRSFGTVTAQTTIRPSAGNITHPVPLTIANAPLAGSERSAASRTTERSIATKIKNQRRADIERRCNDLDPPLLGPELLNSKAFNAAVQIAQPLDDAAWELLKSRLLAERVGHLIEIDNISLTLPSRETVIAEEVDDPRESSHDLVEQAQRPTRDKVVEIAQDYIKRCFMNGIIITEVSAPRFAADVLEHVGTRFYELQHREDAALALQGKAPLQNSESGMRTRHLQLRHIRYVVDKCIVPHTDQVQKELFLCESCEPSEKLFPFHSLIQHYASKHTNNFSSGQRVVDWSSEWPSTPPFRKPRSVTDAASGYLAHAAQVALPLNHISAAPASSPDEILATRPTETRVPFELPHETREKDGTNLQFRGDAGTNAAYFRSPIPVDKDSLSLALTSKSASGAVKPYPEPYPEHFPTTRLSNMERTNSGYNKRSGIHGNIVSMNEGTPSRTELLHPQPIQLHSLVNGELLSPTQTVLKPVQTQPLVDNSSSKQVDDFYQIFLDDHQTIGSHIMENEASTDSKSTPRQDSRFHHIESSDRRVDGSYSATYHEYPASMTSRFVNIQNPQANHLDVDSHYPPRFEYDRNLTQPPAQYRQYRSETGYGPRSWRGLTEDRLATDPSSTQRHSHTEEPPSARWHTGTRHHLDMVSDEGRSVVHNRAQMRHTHFSHAPISRDMLPTKPEYIWDPRTRKQYLVERVYVPVDDEAEVGRAYERRPSHYDGRHRSEKHAEQDSYLQKDPWRNYHR